MKNYRNNKRGRFRSNGSGFGRNGGSRNINSFTNVSEFQRKTAGKNSQSIQKLIEKYTDLGKEAISKGDKILSENYFQHADHFIRIINQREIENKEKNYEADKIKKDNISETQETTD
tara:strand:+ start:447 stop:797 length:351 start_codon:yes stop_codon:yes gene_type:complete